MRGQQILQNWPWTLAKRCKVLHFFVLKETWMTWQRQRTTTVCTNGVLNNWYDDSMIIMGCFFLCIPLRESSIHERSPVNSWGTMRRAISRIRWNCVRMLLMDCTTRTPRTSDWPTTDWNQRNQLSKPTHFRKVFGSPVECHFNYMQSVVLLDCQDLSNPNQRKHAPSWTWYCHKSFFWITLRTRVSQPRTYPFSLFATTLHSESILRCPEFYFTFAYFGSSREQEQISKFGLGNSSMRKSHPWIYQRSRGSLDHWWIA